MLLTDYPAITKYPVHFYVLFTPSVGRSDKLLPRHREPFQVLDRTISIYTIEDMRTTTLIHNLRPFNYDPERTSPLTVAQHNEQDHGALVERTENLSQDFPCNFFPVDTSIVF
jgi:hypothetical protein